MNDSTTLCNDFGPTISNGLHAGAAVISGKTGI